MRRPCHPHRDLRYCSRCVHSLAVHIDSASHEYDPSGPLLSVVVATTDAADSLDACLSALQAATAHTSAEIVVVDAARECALRRSANVPAVRTITAPPGTLVPRLWLRGLHVSRGRFVAFTIAQCVVSQGWADQMIAGMTEGVGGQVEHSLSRRARVLVPGRYASCGTRTSSRSGGRRVPSRETSRGTTPSIDDPICSRQASVHPAGSGRWTCTGSSGSAV